MSIDLEKGIEKLIKGEKLDSAGGEDEESGGETFANLDLAKVRAEMQIWEHKVQEIGKNEAIKANADHLMRDFVVVVRETKYDTEKSQMLTKYENVNVLVGDKDSIDALKPEIEKFVADFGGSFKTNFRIQAM